MKRKYNILIIGIIFLFILLYHQSAYTFGIMPLTIDLDLEPGETREFAIDIIPGNSQQNVLISVYYPYQRLDGSMQHIKVDPDDYPVTNWIDVPNQIMVNVGERPQLRGSITVPFGVSGFHSVALIFQEDVEEEPGIHIRFRYAVRININVHQPWLRETIELVDFLFTEDRIGRPQLISHIKNTSNLAFGVYGEVEVRDENRRLVERVVLRTAAGDQGTRIYPNTEVQFKNVISETLFPGDYNLRLSMRYADGRQIISSKQITVGDEFIRFGKQEYVDINPKFMSINLRPGAASTEVILLENKTGQSLNYNIETVEIFKGYNRSIFASTDFQLMGNNRNTISPRGQDRLLSIIRTPRDLEAGGYYGNIELEILNIDGNIIETKIIEIELLVGSERVIEIDILDFIAFEDNSNKFFSLSIRNNSNIAIKPEARASIYKNDQLLRTIPLRVSEDLKYILPGISSFMTGQVLDLEPDNYLVLVEVIYNNKEIATKEFIVEIN